ncbi:hypothetical protein [Caballeronia grimmiae]|uniref:hypothetical protein n=1 Tax=Caballeronia grimmiae TaxID=1071679 RepID=UPI001267F43C|nr:hypothetical protein [Caballeronia grimmiae]
MEGPTTTVYAGSQESYRLPFKKLKPGGRSVESSVLGLLLASCVRQVSEEGITIETWRRDDASIQRVLGAAECQRAFFPISRREQESADERHRRRKPVRKDDMHELNRGDVVALVIAMSACQDAGRDRLCSITSDGFG